MHCIQRVQSLSTLRQVLHSRNMAYLHVGEEREELLLAGINVFGVGGAHLILQLQHSTTSTQHV